MKNNYKKLVTHCLFLAKTVVIVGLTLLSLKSSAQYCISGATQLNDDDIGAFSFGNFSNVQSTQALNNSTSINTYTNFTYLSPVQAQQGSYYPINITQINSSNSFYQCTAVIYIDFNHSNTFDAGEDVYRGITVAGINGNVLNGFVYIPTSALTGNARMRVVLSEDPSTTACGNYSWGETEDYKINIAAAVPCSGTPTAGSLSINDTSVCVGTNLSIMLSGNSQGTGVTSQWEISTDGVSFTATGDTLALLNITSPSDSIYYRVKVSCNGGLPVYTLITKIKASPNYLCYCKSNLGASCFGAIISNVAIASTLLNNSSNCSVGYDLYYPTTSTTTTNLKQAQNYVVTVNTNSATSGGVWIDTDASGTFDASEYSALAFNGGLTASTNLLIPSSGTLGNIGMRVRVAQYTWNAVNANTSCTNLYGGEIEDYIVNIIPGTPCVGTPTAGMLNFTDTAICTGSSLSIILNGNTQGTGITTTWEISTDGVSYTATGDSLPLLTINLSSDSIYYRVKVSCNGGTPAYSTVTKIKASPANQCYCTANLGGYCGSGQTNDFSIASTTLSNLNSGCGTNFGIANYSKFPASGNTTASLIQAVTYTFNGKFDVNVQQAAIWIDLDHSGTFDAIEYYQWPAPSANTTPLAILIPASAQVGATGLRIRSRAAGFSASDACNQFGSGETEDYIITIAPGTPCSGAPTAGVLSASNLIPCPSTTDTLSITGTTQALGITHTWETSINGINFTATGDSTLSLIDFGINSGDSIYYRVAVACNGGTPVYTNIVKLKANINIYTCYCNTNLGADCSGAIISNVNILSTTLNSNSACTTGYNFYYPTTSTTTADIKQAVGYTINVNAPTAVVGGVWLDLDHSGTFDGAEYHPLTFTGAAGTTTVFLPANTILGKTGMRVRVSTYSWSGLTASSACNNVYGGEVEDYVVNVIAGTPCSGTPTAGTISISDTMVCAGTSLNLMLLGNTQGIGIVTEWEQSLNGVNFTATGDSTLSANFLSPTDSIYYRVKVSCNGGTPVYTAITKIKASPYYACYCSANLGGDCFGAIINNVNISNTALNNSSTCAGGYSSYYPSTANTTTDLAQGLFYNFNIGTSTGVVSGVWIDYDQSGTFDAVEYTPLNMQGNGGVTNIAIPTSATLGKTGLRVRTTPYTWAGLNANAACTYVYGGEIEDYVINIIPGVPCSGVPNAGVLTTSLLTLCSTDIATLTLTGQTQALNIHTVWETSANGTTGWTATGDSLLTISQFAPIDSIFYRISVDCSGGTPVYSNTIKLLATPSNFCYCTPNLGGDCNFARTEDVVITGTTLNNINNGCGSYAGVISYSLFPDTGSTTATLTQTGSYSVVGRFESITNVAFVWIDYDHSGTFEVTEMAQWPAPSATSSSVTITVPANALPGKTGMRVRSANVGSGTFDACSYAYYGETEDYKITIAPATPCSGTPVAGILTATDTVLCQNYFATLQLNGTSINTGINTVWETSSNGITGWVATGDLSSYITISSPTDSLYYRVAVDCNGGVPAFSNVIKIKLNTTTYGCYCKSAPVYNSVSDIGGVTIGVFNNNQSLTPVTNNTTAINKYTNFTSLGTIGLSKSAASYPISVTQIDETIAYANYVAAYIDYDHSGSFESNEEVLIGKTYIGGITAGSNVVNGTFTIPPTALNGITGMRFILSYDTIISSCGVSNNYNYGETEDYLVNIIDTVITSVAKTVLSTVNFVAYPNPTLDEVTIALQGNTNNAVKCEILNCLGQVVYSNTIKQINGVEKLKVDLSRYTSGAYIVRVIANNNVSVKRILLQR